MIETVFLALALSLDAMSVALAVSAKEHHEKTAITLALFFGFFQAFMPLLGYIGSLGLQHIIGDVTRYIALALLLILGLRMIYHALRYHDNDELPTKLTLMSIILLSIATSIDAMAAGLGLGYLPLSPFLSVSIIGIITMFMSYIGSHIGKKIGSLLEQKAEIFGGIVLIGIGLKIAFF